MQVSLSMTSEWLIAQLSEWRGININAITQLVFDVYVSPKRYIVLIEYQTQLTNVVCYTPLQTIKLARYWLDMIMYRK